jgi:hypothetical protein
MPSVSTGDSDTIWVMFLTSVIATFISIVLLASLLIVHKQERKGPFIGIQVTVLLLLCLSVTMLFDNFIDNITKFNKSDIVDEKGQRTYIIGLGEVRTVNIISAIIQMVAGVLCIISFGFMKRETTSKVLIYSIMVLLLFTLVNNGTVLMKNFHMRPKHQ